MKKHQETTLQHINRVRELLYTFCDELTERAEYHDQSKFSAEEDELLEWAQEYVDEHGWAKWGTPEYDMVREKLAPMLEHHHKENRHHPEYYELNFPGYFANGTGVNGMTLADVVEMFHDWKAANERANEGTIHLSDLRIKFGLSDQLYMIFKNTCEEYGWKYD